MNKFTVKIAGAMLLAGVLFAGPAWAQKKYDAGASDTEIKIGNVSPYTGWAKDYGAVGRAEAAYFRMVNERGGVNGRKINFVSEDLGAASGAEIAERSTELTRKLVERDGVLLMFSSFGTEGNPVSYTHLDVYKRQEIPTA